MIPLRRCISLIFLLTAVGRVFAQEAVTPDFGGAGAHPLSFVHLGFVIRATTSVPSACLSLRVRVSPGPNFMNG